VCVVVFSNFFFFSWFFFICVAASWKCPRCADFVVWANEKISHVCTSHRPPRNWSEILKSGQQQSQTNQQQRQKKQNPNGIPELNSTLDFGLGFIRSLFLVNSAEILSEFGAEYPRFLGCWIFEYPITSHILFVLDALPPIDSILFWLSHCLFTLLNFGWAFVYNPKSAAEVKAMVAKLSHRCLKSLGVVTKKKR